MGRIPLPAMVPNRAPGAARAPIPLARAPGAGNEGDNDDEGPPPPPMPSPNMAPEDYLAAMLELYHHDIDIARTERSRTAVSKMMREAIELHKQLDAIRAPARPGIWDVPVEEREARWTVAMKTAPLLLLELAAAELAARERAKKGAGAQGAKEG